MSNGTKVLTGLMERRALEAELERLAYIADPREQLRHAEQIAQHGLALLPVLVAALDTGDPQMRGGLGQLATLLDRQQMVEVLRAAARARDRSDQARLTALTILDRFLGEPVEEELLAGLADPDGVARQSLRELSHEMSRDPLAIIEYLGQLAQQPSEVARLILDTIPEMPPDEHWVTLLRMFSQGDDPLLAQAALEQLSRTRSSAAAEALATLIIALPPPLATLAERGLRKLQMRGIQAPEPASIEWRALLSPVDGLGNQVVWFLNRPAGSPYATMLSFMMRDPVGVTACFGSDRVPATELPKDRAPGEVHLLPSQDGSSTMMLLEVPLDIGRQTLREAAAMNWSSHEPAPLNYRYFNARVWSAAPLLDTPGIEVEPEEEAGERTRALLDHPAFRGWRCQCEALSELATDHVESWRLTSRQELITSIARSCDQSLIVSYARRLRNMARWLRWLAQPGTAALAASAARQLEQPSPWQAPFLRRLIGIGLDQVAAEAS